MAVLYVSQLLRQDQIQEQRLRIEHGIKVALGSEAQRLDAGDASRRAAPASALQ